MRRHQPHRIFIRIYARPTKCSSIKNCSPQIYKKCKNRVLTVESRMIPILDRGSNPFSSATPEQSSLCSGLFFAFGRKISHPPAPLLLLFRKKPRSTRLFGCKRPHDGSLSLPTFCEFRSSTATAEIESLVICFIFIIIIKCELA